MGRKQRLRAERKAQVLTKHQIENPPAPERLKHLDRWLTGLGFLALLGLAVFVAPGLARKQDHDFQTTVSQSMAALEQPELQQIHAGLAPLLQGNYTPAQLGTLLQERQLRHLRELNAVEEQKTGTQGVVHMRFQQEGQTGWLSALYLNLPELTLQNRWRLASLCRSDRAIQQQAELFVTALQQQRWESALALTTASLHTPPADAPDAARLQSLRRELPTQAVENWESLRIQDHQLVIAARWPSARLRLRAQLDPLSCQARIAGTELLAPGAAP
ncbi:MAG: hypothetical protein ACO1RX_17185 [Candidatus Sericytochromatia bacterium]